jgi:hypothetical protein
LLYAYIFFLIGREDINMDLYELKKLISKWFFMCSITGRYTGSPETAMESDLARLRGIESPEQFKNVLDEIIEGQLTNDFWSITLPMFLSTSSSTSPSLYAYYAAQYIHGAYGLFSKLKISDLLQEGLRSKKSALERHHLFPKAWLERNGVIDQTQRNQIANYALIEWNDNINISDKEPSQYLPNYLNRLTIEDKVKMYYWHALSENWEHMDYSEFLVDRRKRIAQVVKDAYEIIRN